MAVCKESNREIMESYKSDFAAVRFMDSWMSISLVTCQDAETKPAIIESGAQWRKLLGSTV